MSSPEAAGRMALWAIELSEFDIHYRPRTAIKGQAVADFIAEYTQTEHKGAYTLRQWNIHTNGSSNKKAGGTEVLIQTTDGEKIKCMIRQDFPTTNNEAEYEALVAGLDLARAAGAEDMVVHCDSQVIIGQISGAYECRGKKMKKYLEEVKSRIGTLQVTFVQIPREENECADRLAKATSAELMTVPDQVLSFIQNSLIIDKRAKVQEVNPENNWTTPLIAYLKAGTLPDDRDTARKLKVRASRFVMINDVLYKRGFSRPYLRCLGHEKADYVMREVHEGICENHSEARSLVHKLIRAGFGIPRVLVSDNGKQFDNKAFQDFCLELSIRNHYSSPAHPQANGQVEVTNQSLLKIIKTRLEGAKGIWPDELPSVLWAYRTTARTPTGETPFRLAYGSEAVIPAEIGLTSYRVESYNNDKNEEALQLQLDLIDEVRATAKQRLARYQNLMAKYYNSNVRHRDFQIGDLVLQKVMGAAKDPSQGKLGPNWERPYKISSWQRKGTYHLETMDGRKLQHPWNTEHLRKYY
ncbi:uncharacterized protein LOC136064573 [Quercus suber]|uniref:uncharacterized protein LOC136064573 n=1 Tax=Quercus suber TaxID=58331 RepID=UPI0032DE4E23